MFPLLLSVIVFVLCLATLVYFIVTIVQTLRDEQMHRKDFPEKDSDEK